MLRRIAQYSHLLEARIVQGSSNSLDLAVYHRRRRNNVCSSPGVANRNLSQTLQSLIVLDCSITDYATVAVAGVLAHANIGKHDDLIAKLVLDLLQGLLNNPVLVRGRGPRVIFDAWDSEENHRPYSSVL